MQDKFRVGDVVLSKAGHDSDDHFVIVQVVDDEYVKVVDGKRRLLVKPKLKKIKHLKSVGLRLDVIAEKLENGSVIHDKNIESALIKVLKQ